MKLREQINHGNNKIEKRIICNKKVENDIVTTCTFIFLIFVITTASLLVPIKTFSQSENRYLEGKPKFSFDSLIKGKYTKDYETFITDQFVLRDSWIRVKTMSERAMLKQDINSVYFAKDNYLIQKYDIYEVSKIQEASNIERLNAFVNKYSDKLGKDKVKVMLVPTASVVLEEKLPPFATGYNQKAFIELVINKLLDNSVVDISDTLAEHKEEYIYYRTDHHWTTLGAFYAYEKWAKEIGFTPLKAEEFNITLASNEFYGTLHSKVNIDIEPDSIFLYEIKKNMDYQLEYNLSEKAKTLYDMNMLAGKDKYSVYMGGNNALVQIKTNNQNGRRLLVIKDSFAHSFVPFAVNHYEETFMIDLRYFNGGIEEYIKENNITDILVLYNTMNFVLDKNTIKFEK